MISRGLLPIAGALVMLAATPAPAVADDGWPKVIEGSEGTLTVYQPQADSYEGDRLQGRAAVSWTDAAGGQPLFGAVWLDMRVEVDRDAREVNVRELEVPQVRFPDASPEDQEKLSRYLEAELPGWDLPLSLDRLIADLDLVGEATTAGLRHEPPKIMYSEEPAILVLFDGDPKVEAMDGPQGSDLERVVNTPYLVVRDRSTGSFFLSGGGALWYVAKGALGPWTPAAAVPAAVSRLVEPDEEIDPAEKSTPPPKILVATEPTELIVSDGKAAWAPVEGVPDLLYMTNTDSDVLLEISSQLYYVLLGGRWFRGVEVDRVWQWDHVPNDELPAAFATIPDGSAVSEVLAHVAGTVQAREAVLDNAIPQTAAVRRDDASLEVSYDGAPKFEPVEGAEGGVQAAVNTSRSVFKHGSRYFCCEQGVWYEAAAATGPWRVATDVPLEIYTIPASSPHHNVTYVRVYDVTPQVVYVGYTPGYMGSYWYGGCVVYGTGWYYRPWYGPYYYPRPWTWGLNVHYNPWYGWSFGLTFSNGPFTFAFWHPSAHWHHHHYGGWWGPGPYRPYPRPYVGHGYTRPPRPVPYGGGGARPAQMPAGGARPAARPATPNLYNRPENRDRMAQQPATRDRRQPTVARDSANDVLTDRSGNVYRRDQSGGWQQHQGGQWRPADNLDQKPSTRPGQPSAPPGGGTVPSTRPSQPSAGQVPSRPSTVPSVGQRPTQPSTLPSRSPQIGSPSTGAVRPGLERDWSGRQRGATRSQGYSPSPRPAPRGGGGTRRR